MKLRTPVALIASCVLCVCAAAADHVKKTSAPAGPAAPMSDADLFANLNLEPPALAEVKRAFAANNMAAAKAALAAHFKNRTTPTWNIDWRQPEFRASKRKAGDDPRAEKVLQHKFDYTQGPNKRDTLDFGKKIDWTANPTQGEARTHLWNESLNRHFHFRTLADAYWRGGQDKYAQEIADEILDWVRSNPAVQGVNGNKMPDGCEAWQTLTTSIRLADVWPNAIYRCLSSPAFNDEVICTIYKSVCEQARHLMRWPSRGNWLTSESNGLFVAGMLFPEFNEAPEWRRTGLSRLYKQLDDEVYPDGMEYELAGGYNNWVVAEFAGIIEHADRNGLRGEIPADFLAKMEKMFDYLCLAAMPCGAIPGLNDSNNADIRKLMETGFKLFPKRADFQFIATDGKDGRAPAETSHAFPWSGHYVMRSGWDKDATYLVFDAGPYGAGHQHEDKLHFILWSHGRQLVLDPGNFSYDHSRWRYYVLNTVGHNTVMVDGQGQHRSGRKETYFWPQPWTDPVPPKSDALWKSTPEFDSASGVYADGYGGHNEIAVRHERQIVFLKPERVFLICDTLTPKDAREHTYQALFHLDAAEASSDAATKTVRAPNLAIVPASGGGLDVSIVKGKEDEPVQGWSNAPWRAIPTAIYQKAGAGVVRFCFVLEPLGSGAAKVLSVEQAETFARVKLADGNTITIQLGAEPAVTRGDQKPAAPGAKNATDSTPPKPLPKPRAAAQSKPKADAVATWSGKLLERARQELAAGRHPSYTMDKPNVSAEIVSCDAAGQLAVNASGARLDVKCEKLSLAERAALACALARSGKPDDHALAAFFLMASGHSGDSADQHLRNAGKSAERVLSSFESVDEK